MRHHDVLIIGGGPSGAALATELAMAGREVTIVERDAATMDRVCGGFLSVTTLRALQRLGIDTETLGAPSVDAVRIAIDRHAAQRMRLPFCGASLSRHALDTALTEAAIKAGAQLRRGCRIVSLEGTPGQWQARSADGEIFIARDLFLATGKHDLRGWPRPAPTGGGMLGFKLHWILAADQARALNHHVELATFTGGYAGLEMAEGGRANLCLVVKPAAFSAAGGDFPSLLAAIRKASPHLQQRLNGATPIEDRPYAISAIPYGHIQQHADGIWRLGDQAAVIPSLAGEGIAMALESARLAASVYLAGETAEQYQQRFAARVRRPMRMAGLISRALLSPIGRQAITLGLKLAPMAVPMATRATRVPVLT